VELNPNGLIGDQVRYVSKLSKKIAHFQRVKDERADDPHPSHFTEAVCTLQRKRSGKKRSFSDQDLIDITHKVLIQQEFQRDVAKEFRTTQQAVSNIVRSAIKDPSIFEKRRLKKEGKQECRDAVKRGVNWLQAYGVPLESANSIALAVKDLTEINVSNGLVKDVLKKDIGMRYRRIQRVPLHLNSVKNRILRQQWAIKYLELIRDKIWLDIDESWLSDSAFLRKKWSMPGDNNSLPVQFVVPRITVITGLDSLGNLYLSLSQANSNSATMEVFLHHLAAKLDRERPGWR
jgi:hypothetical protein